MRTLFFILLLFGGVTLVAQKNLQNYTPSVLFKKGDWEFKTFQNLYTQTKLFNSSGGKEDTGNRAIFFSSINQFLYGINDKINVGLDVWIKASNNFGDAFSPSHGLTGIGPRIKISPFKNIPRLSFQTTFLFNFEDDPEGRNGDRYFLEWDASLWLTQIYFDLPLSEKTQLFFQHAFWYRLTKKGSSIKNNFLETQTSVFFSYFPHRQWTIYGMSEYFPTHFDFGNDKPEAFFAYFIQSGIGVKYQLIPNLIELEVLYTNFWNGSEGKGAGETINFGIRLIHQK